MTKSLVGGLVPLGKGSTPGSSGSNTLSGGLIPLTGQNKSRSLTAAAAGGSTATFGRLGQDSDGSDDWDKDDDKSTSAGDAAGGSFTFTEGNNEVSCSTTTVSTVIMLPCLVPPKMIGGIHVSKQILLIEISR